MQSIGKQHTSRAPRLQERLRRWDQGNRQTRIRMLEEFIDMYQHATGPQLESELENGASLFLARISSWLRLSYALGHSVGLQLQAISVFIAASSGQRFLAEFVEVGGIATVIEILKLPGLSEEDKARATSLLSSVAAAGRHYKEIVCEGYGIEVLEGLMRSSKSEDQLEEARELLVTLGRGNPAFSTHVHKALLRLLKSESSVTQRLACSGLRTLLGLLPTSQLYVTDEAGNSVPVVDSSYCEAAVGLLSSFNLQLLYEANELFTVLISMEQLEESLLEELVKQLVEAADDAQPGGKQVPLHMQASAARALGQLLSGIAADKREQYTSQLQIVPWLCTLLARSQTPSPECEKAAVQALQLLSLCAGSIAKDMQTHLGPRAVRHLLDATDASQAMATMTPDMLTTIRGNIEAFLAEHRRKRRPPPMRMPGQVNELLSGADDKAAADEGGETETGAELAADPDGSTRAQPEVA